MAENNSGEVVDEIDVEQAPAHEAEGSFLSGWPAMLISLAMVSAALYSFSPRDPAIFDETKIEANQLLVSGIARQGSRYIGAGELGIILYADSPKGPWKQATIENNRGSNFTDVKFVGEKTALAVGHSGWLVRSTDGGETWQELAYKADNADPLLSISGPFEKGAAKGKIFAYGAFGQYMVSEDGGKSFRSETLNVVEEEPEPEPVPEPEMLAEADGSAAADQSVAGALDSMVAGAKQVVDEAKASAEGAAQAAGDAIDGMMSGDVADAESTEVAEAPAEEADPFSDDDYDPFADFGSGGGMQDFTTLHYYDIAQLNDGSLLLVGEQGTLLKSKDGGVSWVASEQIYTGSLYGILPMGKKRALVYGMRGNAFVTEDLGETWTKSEIPLVQGLYGGVVNDAGTIVLVGASNTVLVSRDKGQTFEKASSRGPYGLVGIVPLDSGSYLTAGEGGLSIKNVLANLAAIFAGDWS